MNKQMELCFNQKKKQKKTKQKAKEKESIFDPLVKSLNVTLSTSLFMFHPIFFSPHFFVHVSLLFPSVHISLFMFHCYSFSPHFIVHVSLLFPSVHSPSHSPTIFPLFGCIHITWSFNLMVSFTFQPIPSMEINDLPMSLDKFLILDKYSLLETGLR